MSTNSVEAPDIKPGEKIKGPASYFPSITEKYGEPIQHWLNIAADEIVKGKRHSEVVAMLKEDHGMGHGHANAIVGYVRAKLEA
ncbi:DUF4287 domain-containing protein [Leucobacter coleopterorum]|uniref:DUF4287 domain-containing protein n=1 Tax=Leucobacter coleopterorum TaxID=2714933 RepID=A0ABX6JYU8_9MICO|nr:DUF4287 domain-containing protein [Leucobacter coleopterorum]QIM19498.1 DUF4287 domain-containing protein [Leucobacter coleopterorum]